VLKAEEEQFAKTLEQGLKILEQDLPNSRHVVPGDVVFKLYDTYGFPMDLTGDIARERNLTIDEEGFEREMEAQRVRARSASSFGMDYNSLVKVDVPPSSPVTTPPAARQKSLPSIRTANRSTS
jgi:alanyl-tRNA synthetase